jgi:myxalamid-type polyketide synthase MxaE and MxaD
MLADDVSIVHAPLWGAGRVIALEHAEIWGALIDADPGASADAAAAQVLQELHRADGEDEVAYRNGVRYAARLTRSEAAPATPPVIRGDASYLITGGAGGIGLVVAEWLASAGAKHLVLTGRRGRPATGPSLDAIEALEHRGVDVRVVAADVSDRDRMSALMDEINGSAAPLRGVIHAAGVLRNDDVRSVTVDAIRDVCRPKVAGAWLLHELTRGLPLDLFVMFSSGASIWGSRGLVHYAAANQFLDALAHARRGAGLAATSINWGPWAEAGMADAEGQRVMAQMGVTAFSSAEGAAALGHALATKVPQLVAAKVDWRIFAPIYRARTRRRLLDEIAPGDAPQGENAGGELARGVAAALPGDRRGILLAGLQVHASAVLGLEGSTPDPRTGLTELGMDSLMAVELRNRLQHALGVPLAPTIAFDSPTLDAMADDLLAALVPDDRSVAGGRATPRAAAPVDADVAQVGLMSEEEVRTLLAGELAAMSLDGIGEDKA